MDRVPAKLALVLVALLAVLPAAGQTGYSVQSDASGKAGDHLFRIDLKTGEATDVGSTGFEDVESLAFSPGCSVLYGVDDVTDRLLTCDTAKGTCTTVGGLGVDVTDTGLAFGRDGRLYMSTDAPKRPSRLYVLDPATGKATVVGAQGQEVTGLAGTARSAGCLSGLWGLGGDSRDNLVCLDTTLGQVKPIGPLGDVSLNDGGLDFAAGGRLFGLADARDIPTRVITLDLATGKATVVATVKVGGKEAGGFEGLAIDQGACTPAAAGIVDAPALSPAGLAALALALAGGGLLVLRRLTPL